MNDQDDDLVLVTDLSEDDLVDLEGDPYIANVDPDLLVSLEFEYLTVAGVERETPTCLRVDFEGFDSVGFPPDHRVRVHRPT